MTKHTHAVSLVFSLSLLPLSSHPSIPPLPPHFTGDLGTQYVRLDLTTLNSNTAMFACVYVKFWFQPSGRLFIDYQVCQSVTCVRVSGVSKCLVCQGVSPCPSHIIPSPPHTNTKWAAAYGLAVIGVPRAFVVRCWCFRGPECRRVVFCHLPASLCETKCLYVCLCVALTRVFALTRIHTLIFAHTSKGLL
jgi:hypothetical protein